MQEGWRAESMWRWRAGRGVAAAAVRADCTGPSMTQVIEFGGGSCTFVPLRKGRKSIDRRGLGTEVLRGR